jgi:hypothetical protein
VGCRAHAVRAQLRDRVDITQDLGERIVGPDGVEVPRLVPHAQVLRQADSSYFTVIETSEFQLLRLLCTGDEPRVKQLIQRNADAGFNAQRVFMMFNNGPIRNRRDDPPPQPNDPGSGGLGRFVPSECNDFWGKALRLLDLASLVRMYVEYTISADHVIPDASSQLAFWANVDSILGTRGNVLVEAVNEADQAINRLEALNQIPRPTRVTTSHGRKGSEQLPVAPGFDYITFHVSSSEWQRTVGVDPVTVPGLQRLRPPAGPRGSQPGATAVLSAGRRPGVYCGHSEIAIGDRNSKGVNCGGRRSSPHHLWGPAGALVVFMGAPPPAGLGRRRRSRSPDDVLGTPQPAFRHRTV